MQMNPTGARKWEEITGNVSKQGNAIAIVLDNQVYSAPGVVRVLFLEDNLKFLETLQLKKLKI